MDDELIKELEREFHRVHSGGYTAQQLDNWILMRLLARQIESQKMQIERQNELLRQLMQNLGRRWF